MEGGMEMPYRPEPETGTELRQETEQLRQETEPERQEGQGRLKPAGEVTWKDGERWVGGWQTTDDGYYQHPPGTEDQEAWDRLIDMDRRRMAYAAAQRQDPAEER